MDKGDCEDYGNSLASHLIAAGVPHFRVRAVCGNCWGYNGSGHLTVYVLGDDLKTWYHINSTSTGSEYSNLTQCPKSNDPNDLIGIKDVWFSYNDQYSWSVFESVYSEDDFNKQAGNKIKITPMKK
jgi:hypothetical protein